MTLCPRASSWRHRALLVDSIDHCSRHRPHRGIDQQARSDTEVVAAIRPGQQIERRSAYADARAARSEGEMPDQSEGSWGPAAGATSTGMPVSCDIPDV